VVGAEASHGALGTWTAARAPRPFSWVRDAAIGRGAPPYPVAMTAAWLVKLINDHAAAYGSMTDATATQLLANSWLWGPTASRF
jgi:hypothetical protein